MNAAGVCLIAETHGALCLFGDWGDLTFDPSEREAGLCAERHSQSVQGGFVSDCLNVTKICKNPIRKTAHLERHFL